MNDLRLALIIIEQYNNADLAELSNRLSSLTNQFIPEKAIVDFHFTGLNKIDFLTSDFLNKYGVKNLLQFYNEQSGVLNDEN